jgi:hypothetical protein
MPWSHNDTRRVGIFTFQNASQCMMSYVLTRRDMWAWCKSLFELLTKLEWGDVRLILVAFLR